MTTLMMTKQLKNSPTMPEFSDRSRNPEKKSGAEMLIRRNSGILKSRSPSPRINDSPTWKKVHFEPPGDLKTILQKYSCGGARNNFELGVFLTHLKNEQGVSLINWLQVLQDNAPGLTPELEPFVLEILNINWTAQEQVVAVAFKHFVTSLITAHVFYVKPVVEGLVKRFDGGSIDETAALTGQEVNETRVFQNIHDILKGLLAVAPLATKDILLKSCQNSLPYILFPSIKRHTRYIENLTRVMDYMPSKQDRVTILKIIIRRLVDLDGHLSKDDVDSSDDEDDEEEDQFQMDGVQHELEDSEIAERKLDKCMMIMFEYLGRQPLPSEIFRELLPVFENFILPSYCTAHVQFLLFYLMSLDEKSSMEKKMFPQFLKFLWRTFNNPNTSSIIRQATVGYIASFVSRAKYVSIDVAMDQLKKLTDWIHCYMASREDSGKDYMFTDLKAHGPFYAACQSAFYIFAFRHQEFAERKKLFNSLRQLNFATIVTGHLNPLKVCLPAVVKQFSAICRKYQLVYCDTVIERNNRINLPTIGSLSTSHVGGKYVLLDDFFPFDPYRLKESNKFVSDIYRVYVGPIIHPDSDDEDDSEDSDMEVEDDEEDEVGRELRDLVTELEKPKSSRKRHESTASFEYGTSPGFKY